MDKYDFDDFLSFIVLVKFTSNEEVFVVYGKAAEFAYAELIANAISTRDDVIETKIIEVVSSCQ